MLVGARSLSCPSFKVRGCSLLPLVCSCSCSLMQPHRCPTASPGRSGSVSQASAGARAGQRNQYWYSYEYHKYSTGTYRVRVIVRYSYCNLDVRWDVRGRAVDRGRCWWTCVAQITLMPAGRGGVVTLPLDRNPPKSPRPTTVRPTRLRHAETADSQQACRAEGLRICLHPKDDVLAPSLSRGCSLFFLRIPPFTTVQKPWPCTAHSAGYLLCSRLRALLLPLPLMWALPRCVRDAPVTMGLGGLAVRRRVTRLAKIPLACFFDSAASRVYRSLGGVAPSLLLGRVPRVMC